MNQSEKIRRIYTLTGYVQGVGLRYKAKCIAEHLNLTGYVQNGYDGSVTLAVEGRRHTIENLLETLSSQRYIEFDSINYKTVPAEGGYGFEIL